MLKFYDYLPSQNAWKVRQILGLTGTAHETHLVSIFEGEGQSEEFLTISPWGAVPALALDDGKVLSESSAILWYLAAGTKFLPEDRFLAAKVQQWLSFEIDYVQNSIGSLQYWNLTGKIASRSADIVSGKVAVADRALGVLDRTLADRAFILGDAYSIADIALYAYAHRAADAGLRTEHLPNFTNWLDRVRNYGEFFAETHLYSIDPYSAGELS